MTKRAGSLLALALGLASTACSTERTLYQLGIPGVGTDFRVTRLEERGGFLDATLSGEAGTLRFFAPPSEACRSVLGPEAEVEFAPVGAGRATRDDRHCDAAGFGPVEELRKRGPDPGSLSSTPIPREQASYRVVHEDGETIFLRGRFPLAGLVGWAGGDDTIAVVSPSVACREVASRTTASLEFRPRGSPTLSLVSSSGPCAIDALIRPGAPYVADRGSMRRT